MRQTYARAIVLIALSMPLGACSSFLGIKFARHAPRTEPAALAIANTDSLSMLGRQQLADGQTGLAIETFRKAMAGGEPIAPAVNGLGVAYARLGRFDLAQRYFQQAMASDPTNTRYADNLARLMMSPTFAMRRSGDAIQVAVQSATLLELASAVAATAEAKPAVGKLQRVSRGEVRIATAPPQTPPVTASRAAKGFAAGGGEIDSRFKPLVRFSLAEATPSRSKGAIRIVLPDPKPADAAIVAAAAKAKAVNAAR